MDLAHHYFICDYLQMRDWVLAFTAPLGKDHWDHASWRADLRLYPEERVGYFRWGDEPVGVNEQPGRVFEVDNAAAIAMPPPAGQHVGGYGAGGESDAVDDHGLFASPERMLLEWRMGQCHPTCHLTEPCLHCSCG